ncbi:MAG: TM0996/MTH895 family glutaredoxin-like protein [Archaeoglobi archaeon]|nr:TM0996/MTH895 family glutaredoxin-like protein [Candidatus Mnemosynella sp.]
MKVEVLGTGCMKCRALEENVKKALKELRIEAEVRKVEKIEEIISYGVMSTPALVIDGEIVSEGKVLSVEELKEMLRR